MSRFKTAEIFAVFTQLYALGLPQSTAEIFYQRISECEDDGSELLEFFEFILLQYQYAHRLKNNNQNDNETEK